MLSESIHVLMKFLGVSGQWLSLNQRHDLDHKIVGEKDGLKRVFNIRMILGSAVVVFGTRLPIRLADA